MPTVDGSHSPRRRAGPWCATASTTRSWPHRSTARASLDAQRRVEPRGRVRLRSGACRRTQPRSTPSCRTTSPEADSGRRALATSASASVQLRSTALSAPAWARTVNAPGEAVDQLPAAGGGVRGRARSRRTSASRSACRAMTIVSSASPSVCAHRDRRRGRSPGSAGRWRPGLRPRAAPARHAAAAPCRRRRRLAGAADDEPAQLVEVRHARARRRGGCAAIERRAGDQHADANVEVRAGSPRCRGAGSRPSR